MAGDWIKMRADLQTHPKVVRILSAIKRDKFAVIGGLHAVWSLFDAHSEDGLLSGYSLSTLDEMIGFPGFSAAMAGVGWLEETPQGLITPRFDEHNGVSAKRRTSERERKRESRKASVPRPESVRKVSAKMRDKSVTREEKRREDIEDPPNPPGGGRELFERFLAEFPEARRVKVEGAWADWCLIVESGAVTAEQLVDAIRDQAAAQAKVWAQDGGRSCPAPTRWLRERRWLDLQGGAATTMAWAETRSGIEAMGERLGVGRWDQAAFECGGAAPFPVYERRVREAYDAAQQTSGTSH